MEEPLGYGVEYQAVLKKLSSGSEWYPGRCDYPGRSTGLDQTWGSGQEGFISHGSGEVVLT